MTHRLSRAGCALLLATSTSLVADQPAPNPSEAALRARVKQFYQMIVDKHYREAEQIVAPESRDYYYDNEKPRITDFDIQAISWEEGHQKANVTLVSNFKLRTPRGEYSTKLPYVTHWEFKDGEWWWFFEKESIRPSAFGPMRVNPELAKKSGINISEMIAKGPKPAQFAVTVKADQTAIRMSDASEPKRVTLSSTFPGTVKLSARVLSGTGFDVELKAGELAVNGKTELVVTRREGQPFQAGHIAVLVNPTSQLLDIGVN